MRKDLLAVFGLIVIAAVVSAAVYYKVQLDESAAAARPKYAVTFVEVGYCYNIWASQNGWQHTYGDTFTFPKGTIVSIGISEDMDHYAVGYYVNNETVYDKEFDYTVNSNCTIEARIGETNYRLIVDYLKENGISVVGGGKPQRSSGFSHSLAYIAISGYGDFTEFCKSKGITTVIYHRGVISHGWIWENYDNFYFMEGETVYYMAASIS